MQNISLTTNIEISISIIIPIYNCETYLHQCLNSVVNQTFTNIEIILVNDGSTDNSGSICNQYALNDKRIYVIHKENGGPNSAVREGLLQAHGEFVYFIDSDDWLENDALESLYTIAHSKKYELVVSSFYQEWGSTHRPIQSFSIRPGSYNKREIECEVLPAIFYTPKRYGQALLCTRWGKLFRRDLLLKNIEYCKDGVNYMEDWFTVIPYLLSIKSMYLVNDSYKYHYRFNINSLSNTISSRFFIENKIFYENMMLIARNLAPHCIDMVRQIKVVLLQRTLTQIRMLHRVRYKRSIKEIQQTILELQSQIFIDNKVKTFDRPFMLRILFWLIKKRAYIASYWLTATLELRFKLKLKDRYQNVK